MRIIGDMCPAINLSPHVISRIRRVFHIAEIWNDNTHSLDIDIDFMFTLAAADETLFLIRAKKKNVVH